MIPFPGQGKGSGVFSIFHADLHAKGRNDTRPLFVKESCARIETGANAACARKKPTEKSPWACKVYSVSATRYGYDGRSARPLGDALRGSLDLAAQVVQRHVKLPVLEIGF